MENDSNTAGHYSRSCSSGDDGHQIPSFSDFSGGKGTAGNNHISGNCITLCSDRTAGDLLSEGRSGKRNRRNTGDHSYIVYYSAS